jgi:hypothetical protein
MRVRTDWVVGAARFSSAATTRLSQRKPLHILAGKQSERNIYAQARHDWSSFCRIKILPPYNGNSGKFFGCRKIFLQ